MNKGEVNTKFKIFFSTKNISQCVITVLITFITFYATDFMGLAPTTVGIVLIVSKIFDGITDLVCGILIDHTHSRLGQARPYELALIGYWGCLVAIFSAPDMSHYASVIYLFVMYTLLNSIFGTMVTCNDAPYLANSLNDTAEAPRVISFAAAISMVFTIVAAVAVPQLISTFATTKEGWRILSCVIAVPMVFVGLLRFLTIKEVRTVTHGKSEQVNLKEDLRLLFGNKYILLIGAMLLISNICSQSLSTNYYCTYILHDIGMASLIALGLLSVVPILILAPVLTKKFGLMRVMTICCFIGAAGFLIKLINPQSIPIVIISSFIGSLGYYPVWFLCNAVIIDTMDYGEWKFGRRAQGTLSCVNGISSKLGTALGAGLLGLMMGMTDYNGLLEIQSSAANNMIIALLSVVPAILCAAMGAFGLFYDLDKQMSEIRSDLNEKR